MRHSISLSFSLLLGFGIALSSSFGQVRAQQGAPATAVAVKQSPQFTFILFWKQQDASTQQFAETLRTSVGKRAERATWTSVNVRDPAHRGMVNHYGVSRAPMPLLLCVAGNGAVTSVFTRRPSDEGIERALVTPAMADVTKALQDKKIVIVHVMASPQTTLPAGASQFVDEPDFAARTTVVDVGLGDPAEARFLADMQISERDVNGSMLVIMAPPGVLVGKFAAATTRDQIVTKLHAAGKCCDDPNCKHNQSESN